jgi:hypothetical protein
MQNQIQLSLAIGAARSTFSRCKDLRRIVKFKPSATESHKVISIVFVIK